MARQAAELAQAEVKARDNHRATEAAKLLRVAQEAEHAMLTHDAEERAILLRREESLIAARRENANLTVDLVVAKKAAEDNLVVEAMQAIQIEAAKKDVAKAERTTRALAASRGEPAPPMTHPSPSATTAGQSPPAHAPNAHPSSVP